MRIQRKPSYAFGFRLNNKLLRNKGARCDEAGKIKTIDILNLIVGDEKYNKKINWTILSENEAIQKKFNTDNWNSGREWFNNIDNYLQTFENKWDWQVLSKNRNINYNRNLLKKFRNKNWNWHRFRQYACR